MRPSLPRQVRIWANSCRPKCVFGPAEGAIGAAEGLVGAAGGYRAGFVGEDDRLDAVAKAELG
jgi:hypothetical protein